MPPPLSRPIRAAVAVATTALLGMAGLAACGTSTAGEQVAPVVLTEDDGTLRGPDGGAEPVAPPSPAPAGDRPTGIGTRPEEEPTEPATRPQPPAPPPPADDPDDADDGDEVEDADDADDADDTADGEEDAAVRGDTGGAVVPDVLDDDGDDGDGEGGGEDD